MSANRRVTVVYQKPSLQDRINFADAKFHLACKQILLLNDRKKQMEIRYSRAVRDGLQRFQYSIRLQIDAVEVTRNLFAEYARRMAEESFRLERRLERSEDSEASSSSDSDSD